MCRVSLWGSSPSLSPGLEMGLWWPEDPKGVCPVAQLPLALSSALFRSFTNVCAREGCGGEGALPCWERGLEDAQGIIPPALDGEGGTGAVLARGGCRGSPRRPGAAGGAQPSAGAGPGRGRPRGRAGLRRAGAAPAGAARRGAEPGWRCGPPWRWGCWRRRSPDRPRGSGGRRRYERERERERAGWGAEAAAGCTVPGRGVSVPRCGSAIGMRVP